MKSRSFTKQSSMDSVPNIDDEIQKLDELARQIRNNSCEIESEICRVCGLENSSVQFLSLHGKELVKLVETVTDINVSF
jgi:uncharacterized protein YfcZ (UPF0381/DUF406 family)